MEAFLKQCEQSGDAAYGALRSLLERLEDPITRTDARIFLSDIQKMHKYSSGIQEIKLDDSNIREAMIKTTSLCINSAAWTGIPGYCRFTVGLEDGDFKRALDCIAKFKSLVDK